MRLSLPALLALLVASCAPESTQDVPATAPGNAPGDPPTARRDMLDDLRLAHGAPQHASDGGGRAWLELTEGETGAVRAGSRGRWTILYEAGPEGIREGGFVRLLVPRFWEWSSAQTQAADYVGYTTCTTEAEGVELEAFDVYEHWVEWRIRGRALESGERLRIVYGAGPAMAVADRYAEHGSQFWIAVDGDGDGFAQLLSDSPQVDVLPGPARQLSLVLPSTAEPGEEVDLRIALLDGVGNAGIERRATVLLAGVPDGIEVPAELELTAEQGGLARVTFRVTEPGVYRILAHAKLGERDLDGMSNPLLVEAHVAPIRWGDLHGHSNLSDGTGLPEDFLTYARDVAGLDVVCLTDHDHWGMQFLDEHPDIWERIQETTEAFHEPGRFVTIQGYEWTSWIHGHRHVLYFAENAPLYSSIDPDYETPAQLWDALRGEQALTFAHHSAGGPIATNWDYPPPPEIEPVTEVASVHGSSEALDAPYRIYSPLEGNFVRDVLDRGYRLGFIGSGDSHDGHPGLAHLASPSGSGLAALLTGDLTREGVYRALRERRAYATNGHRILLRAAIDSYPMGSTIPATNGDERPMLYVRAIGTAPLLGIEVIRSGESIAQLPAEGVWDMATTLDLDPLEAGEYVYVRVLQEDRGTAWSSPFFVDPAEDEAGN